MSVWQDATVNTGTGVITIGSGPDAVRILAPQFVLISGTAVVGFGIDIIMGGGSGGAPSTAGQPIGLLLILTKAS